MRERAALVLKIVCLGLAAWLAWELVEVGKDANPLAHITMPDVPSLPADTNAPPAIASKPPGKPGTNGIVAALNTNGAVVVADTNAAPHKKVRPGETNALATTVSTSTNIAAVTNMSVATNLALTPPTNMSVTIVAETNSAVVATTDAALSNGVPTAAIPSSLTNRSGSNLAVVIPTNAVISGTNLTIAKISGGTNLVGDSAQTNSTNSAMAKASRAARPPNAVTAAMMGGPAGKKPATLPPEIQARVDRVYESEIFGPIAHPMPMALMGIAGQSAFLRAPSGQTGMVKEGEDLGDIKLLRIGTNRVLVEQDGKKQELMIFSGLGGESLLPKPSETSDETTKH